MQNEFEYVGFWPRALAALVDSLVLVASTTPVMVALYGFQYVELEHDHFYGVIDALCSMILPVAFSVLFWCYLKATPGKMMISAEVVDAKTGGRLSIRQSLLRYFACIASISLCGLGVIWIFFDNRRQGLHDKVAGTIVIKRPERIQGGRQALFPGGSMEGKDPEVDALPFNPQDRVYFGRGNFEFVGTVLSASDRRVVVSGVELGCFCSRRATIEVECLDNLKRIDEAEFSRRTLNEPAFADGMSKERFIQLQEQLNGLRALTGKDEAPDSLEFDILELELLLECAPWEINPAKGCTLKPC